MAIRALSVGVLCIAILSGCARHYVTRNLLCNENSGGNAESRAAKCMIAAGIETAQEKSGTSQNQDNADQDEDAGPPAIR